MDINDISQEESEDKKSAHSLNPFLSIWTDPVRTIKYVWDSQPDQYLHRLYMALGVSFVLALRMPEWIQANPNPIGVMIQLLLVGPVMGIMGGYLISEGIRATGGWFGGEASKDAIRITVAWTDVPYIGAYLAYLFSYLLLYFIFRPDSGGQTVFLLDKGAVGYIPIILFLVLFGWAMVIRVRGIAEVQEISPGKAALNFILGLILIEGPVIGMLFVYSIIARQSLSILYQ